MPYIPFTEEQKITANSVELAEFLRMRGERLERAGREYKLVYSDGSGKLNWSSTTDESLLGYNLYKRSSENNSFELLASTVTNEFTDNRVTAGKTYFYYVEAIDSYNNIVASEKVMAVPTDEDSILPTADAGIDLYAIAGDTVSFDGSESTDNHYIAEYKWDFGDGNTADTAKSTHIYSEAGNYTAVLTVKDSAGNSDSQSITVTVYDEDKYTYAEFQLVDAYSGSPVRNAIVHAELPEGETLFNTDYSGNVRIIAPEGTYKFSFYKDGYLPVSVEHTVQKGCEKTTVHIENGEIVTGKIEVERLDLKEIENLGIDTSDPDNQYVYDYHVNIKTNVSPDSEDSVKPKSFHITVNSEGELINTDSYFDFNGVKFAVLDMNTDQVRYVGLIPSSVPGEPPSIVLLDVSTTFTWLKEVSVILILIFSSSTVLS